MMSPVFPSAADHMPSGVYDPWVTGTHENPFLYPTQEPLFSFSKSPTQQTNTSNSCSDDGGPMIINQTDDRKLRRMISNRESARRSRMRKQKHLENLRNLVNRHKSANQYLTDRLRFVTRQEQIIRKENERLKTETGILQQRLWDMHQVMLVLESGFPQELVASGLGAPFVWSSVSSGVTLAIEGCGLFLDLPQISDILTELGSIYRKDHSILLSEDIFLIPR
ncbi:hypothetical protein R6Q57_005524 [Mikania cordata]